jgi:hypothetical protein
MRNIFNYCVDNSSDSFDVVSTSQHSATTQAINLREPTSFSKLVFQPTLVDNPGEPDNTVRGKIVYERKGKKDESFPADRVSSKRDVRNGDSLELSLNTGETRALYIGLRNLYKLDSDMDGIPGGIVSYVQVDNACRTLIGLLRDDPSAARMIGETDTFELVKELLKLLTQGVSRADLDEALASLEDGNLQHLSSSLSLEALERAASDIRENLCNQKEEYWQSEILGKYQWILSQLFTTPCTMFESKAYVGGKAYTNRKGNIPDFLYQNKLTHNLSIIEIKTPCTPILGEEYRSNCYSLSNDMSGSVNQVMSYRESLMTDFANLRLHSDKPFEAFSPKCIVVIGNTNEFADDDGAVNRRKMSSFENYRNSLNGISVITYDELLMRIEDLIAVLKSDPFADSVTETPGEEIPFTPANSGDQDRPF